MEERWFDEELRVPSWRWPVGAPPSSTGRTHGSRLRGEHPLACQDWASTKAAYRFFSNERVERKKTFFVAISTRRATGLPPATARSSFFMTRLSLPGSALGPKPWASQQRWPAAMTSVVARACIRSAAVDAFEPWQRPRMGCRWEWPRSSSGPGRSSRGRTSSRGKINPTRVPIEGKESMRWLDKSAPIHRTAGRPRALRSHLRSRRRHLGAVLSGRGVGHPL